MATALETAPDHIVADLSLAEYGDAEIAIAETEMPGLMSLREEYGEAQPLKGGSVLLVSRLTMVTAQNPHRAPPRQEQRPPRQRRKDNSVRGAG